MNERDLMNNDLFNASGNLFIASKLLKSYVPDFSLSLVLAAERIASIIEAPEEKINKEDMDSILKDILNSKE